MKRGSILACALAFAGCVPVTVNAYLNFTAKLEQALDQNEKKVREAGADKDHDGLPRVAYFQNEPDINLETPAIKTINGRRAKRFKDVSQALDAGTIGEGKDCRLILLDKASELSPKDRKALETLAKNENEDRDNFIKEIIQANKLPKDGAEEKTRASYVKILRKQAKVGWFIQLDDGKWHKKTEEDKKKD